MPNIACIDLKELAPICSKLDQKEEEQGKKFKKPNKKKSSNKENIKQFRPKLTNFRSNWPPRIQKLKRIKELTTIYKS